MKNFLCLLFCASLALLSCSRPPPVPVTWDFTHDYSISRVGWPASNRTEDYGRHGDFDFTLRMREGTLHERTFYIYCQRKGDKVVWFVVHFSNRSTVQEAYDHVRRIMTEWHFPKRSLDKLDQWRDDLLVRKEMAHPFETGGGISIRIGCEATTDDRPCSISLSYDPGGEPAFPPPTRAATNP